METKGAKEGKTTRITTSSYFNNSFQLEVKTLLLQIRNFWGESWAAIAFIPQIEWLHSKQSDYDGAGRAEGDI